MVSLAQNEQGTICPAQGFTLSGRFSRSIFLVYSQNTFLLGITFTTGWKWLVVPDEMLHLRSLSIYFVLI